MVFLPGKTFPLDRSKADQVQALYAHADNVKKKCASGMWSSRWFGSRFLSNNLKELTMGRTQSLCLVGPR